MAFRMLAHSAKQVAPKSLACRSGSHHAVALPTSEQQVYADKIGKREIVGFGWNGLPVYADRVDFPFPAIRYREDSPEILVSMLIFENIQRTKNIPK